MGAGYRAVLWNRQKKIYDSVLVALVVTYVALFAALNLFLYPDITAETLIIRATGSLAILLLHLILMIGPLCRLSERFLPLLYNRRHLGVTMFFIALIHGVFSIIQFHALGDTNPIVSVFISNTHYDSISNFPFQTLGFFALIILFLMAATSHDFWLHNLSAPVWKSLHMLVYVVYGLLIMHVMLGVIQLESSGVYVALLGGGVITIISLHVTTGIKQWRIDHGNTSPEKDGFIRVCSVHDIKEKRAKMITVGKETIAVFKYDGKISAVNNACKHQNGPLGEGKIIDGCITCPWHGYQYLPHNGCSPPPFTEKVATYDVKLIGSDVYVNPKPYPEGTARTPVTIDDTLTTNP